MFRMFAVAAILSLTALAPAARAEDHLVTLVHDAAVKACATKIGASLPLTFYGPINAHCVDRVSADALATIRARQVAKAEVPGAN